MNSSTLSARQTLGTPDAAAAAGAAPRPAASARRWPDWAHEPVLHFLVLGALLFGIDHWRASRQDNPHTIVLRTEVDREAAELFRQARGRPPSAADLQVLRARWLDNEVLYREGLAMGLDQGDSTIRDRVIFKALSTLEAQLKLPAVDDAGLRRWFDDNAARYTEPARVDFLEAVLLGDTSEGGARSLAAALNLAAGQRAPAAAAAEHARSALRMYQGRPIDSVVQAFGADFAGRLQQLPTGQWQALGSASGWRVVQLQASRPAVAGDYNRLRPELMQDWRDATLQAQRTAAVRDLGRRYNVRDEAGQALALHTSAAPAATGAPR